MSTLLPKARLRSLYSDFRNLKTWNPEGYNANIHTWATAFTELLRGGGAFADKTLISARQLPALFADDTHGIPLALDCVLDEIVDTKLIVPLSIFLTTSVSIYYERPWYVPPSPTSVLFWALDKSGLYSGRWVSAERNGTLKDEKYIVVSVLEDVASKIMRALEQDQNGTYTQTVYTRELFEDLCKSIDGLDLSPTDIDVVLVFLDRDLHQIAVKQDTIKLLTSSTSSREVSEQDRAVANLRQTLYDMTIRVDHLTARIDNIQQAARDAVARKHTMRAKYALKSKRLAETAQLAALEMVSKLEQTLHSIDTSVTDAEIFAALKDGVGILTGLNQAVGGAEKVVELADELEDARSDANAIRQEIERLAGSDASAAVDEEELEEEFEQMLAEETAAETRRDHVDDLLNMAPKPPKAVPEENQQKHAREYGSTKEEDDLRDLLENVHLQ